MNRVLQLINLRSLIVTKGDEFTQGTLEGRL